MYVSWKVYELYRVSISRDKIFIKMNIVPMHAVSTYPCVSIAINNNVK